MKKNIQSTSVTIPDEMLMSKIYVIRGQKVMLDEDLAELYGVETKRLNEQVKRNIDRFPGDFMFQLSQEELLNLRSQNATSSWGGRRTRAFAFAEHGVLMLSSVLNSDRAIKVNIQIMRVYVRIREMVMLNKDILLRLEGIEDKLADHDDKIILLFDYIRSFEKLKQQELDRKKRPKIGFKSMNPQ
jgi:hypothetical protein